MGLRVFIRDNINALSFNMLMITILDIVSFLVMFVLILPLPDVVRRGYAGVLCLVHSVLHVVCLPSHRSLRSFHDVLHVQYVL